MRYLLMIAVFIFSFINLNSAVFKSLDEEFTMDMPSGWTMQNAADDNTVVMKLKKGRSEITVKTLADCKNETCLVERIEADLADVKAKKMQVVGNTYTGEEIKRVEFSTGEPMLYINFSSKRADFSAGYFMVNAKAYSILSQGMTYAESDLFFSFISPIPQSEKKSYSTYAIPPVQEVDILHTLNTLAPSSPTVSLVPSSAAVAEGGADSAEIRTTIKKEPKPKKESSLSLAKKKLTVHFMNHKKTFINPSMPPYIKKMGVLFDIIVIYMIAYIAVFFASLILKIFIKGYVPRLVSNPSSFYPIVFNRLYGTPSLIYQAKDNQGGVFISFCTRWAGLFIFWGLVGLAAVFLFMSAVNIHEILEISKVQPYFYKTIYSVCALIIPICIFIFALGIFINLVSLKEYTIYNEKGKKVIYVLQKGYGLKQERYTVYFSNTVKALTLVKKRFKIRKEWELFDSEGELIANFKEKSAVKAVCRMLFGHLWGMLRASYDISGRLETKGSIQNHNTILEAFTANIDKPSAVDPMHLISAAMIMNIRDKDKYYPSL
ncbi:hypothetical protein Dip518_001599 [Parelusimicrobium proximum]|uniref:hypothetical protein n=1 Tax=Parelusimicrobium proximum TaxID=3228953 RepID=UPI003D16545B